MKKVIRKKKSTNKTEPKKPTLWDRLPKNEVERLELMIRMTEKHINPNSKNCTMANQAVRLRAELEILKKQQK